jgi:hypothetical protein
MILNRQHTDFHQQCHVVTTGFCFSIDSDPQIAINWSITLNRRDRHYVGGTKNEKM